MVSAGAGCGPSRPIKKARPSHDGQISRGDRSGQLGCGCTLVASLVVRSRQLGSGSRRLPVARHRPSAILGGTAVTTAFDRGLEHARTSRDHAFGHRCDRTRVSAALRWLFASDLISTRGGVLSHLATDMLTPRGLRLAWPFRKTWSLPLCRTGSPAEPTIVVGLCALALWTSLHSVEMHHTGQAAHAWLAQSLTLVIRAFR